MTDTATKRKPAPRLLLLWNHAADPADADAAGADPDAASAPPASPAGVQDTVADMIECLTARGYRVLAADAEDDIDRITAALVVERPAIVINLIDELYGDDTQRAAVAAYLDLLGYPYLGSEPHCLAICQNRVRTHLVLADADVPVPGFGTIRDINAIPDTSGLRVPLVITQAYDDLYEDEGIERPIYDRDELIERAAALSRESELPLLIEEWLGRRRVHAIVIGEHPLEVLPLVEAWRDAGDDEPEDALPDEDTGEFERVPAELSDPGAGAREEPAGDDEPDEVTLLRDASSDRARSGAAGVSDEAIAAQLDAAAAAIQGDAAADRGDGGGDGGDAADDDDSCDYDGDDDATSIFGDGAAGGGDATPALALAQLDPDTADRVRQLARRAFHAMGCRDIAQIDFHFDDDDQPHVVDVRPHLDLGRGSPFALAARSTHRGWDGVLCELVELVRRRARLAESAAAHGPGAGGPGDSGDPRGLEGSGNPRDLEGSGNPRDLEGSGNPRDPEGSGNPRGLEGAPADPGTGADPR